MKARCGAFIKLILAALLAAVTQVARGKDAGD